MRSCTAANDWSIKEGFRGQSFVKRGLEGIIGSQIDQEDLTLETRKHLYQEGSK